MISCLYCVPISLVVGSTISNNSLKFSPKKSSVCYRQSAISGGNITSFNITIVPAKHVRIGTHGSTQIIMSEYGSLVTT